MDAFDEVRTCCTGAGICNRCWPFITVFIKVTDHILRGKLLSHTQLILVSDFYLFQQRILDFVMCCGFTVGVVVCIVGCAIPEPESCPLRADDLLLITCQ